MGRRSESDHPGEIPPKAGYVPWRGKKRATLFRREVDLLEILQANGPADSLPRAAGELQESMICFLRSEHSRFDVGDGTRSGRLAKLEAQIRAWSSKDVGAILDEYRQRLDRTRIVDS